MEEVPSELGNLKKLELAQFHGNRISGTMPMLNVAGKEAWSYVTDCGNPSAFDVSLGCEECTACCEKLTRPCPIPNIIALAFTRLLF